MSSRVNVLGVCTIALWVGLWEVWKRTGVLPITYVPAPSAIARSLGDLASSGLLLRDTAHTLRACLLSWALAAIVGVVLGVVLGASRFAWRYSMNSFETLRSLPSVTFVPIAILVFGFSTKMEVAIGFYASLWLVLISTYAGMQAASEQLLEVGRVMHMRPWEVLWKIRLPQAAPSIVVGLRLGLAAAFVVVIVSEMVGNPAGIGFAIKEASDQLAPANLFAYLFTVGCIGIVLNALLLNGARALIRGQMSAVTE